MLTTTTAGKQEPKVFCGFDNISSAEVVAGGKVKLLLLSRHAGNTPIGWNLLYLVSSALPDDWWMLLLIAKKKRAKIILNQNGVAYPAWHGAGWRITNQPLKIVLRSASTVVYQSEFCKRSANQFLGVPQCPTHVMMNPVDFGLFKERAKHPVRGEAWTMLLAGNQYQEYRVRCALETLRYVRSEGVNARLVVTGRLCWRTNREQCDAECDRWIKALELDGYVDKRGAYTQGEAPEIFAKSHVLLHTKHNDPCPTVVAEALACGLPVVYVRSGGLPEMVGAEAGEGVDAPGSWVNEAPPHASDLGKAACKVFRAWERYHAHALLRKELFDSVAWVRWHRELFDKLNDC